MSAPTDPTLADRGVTYLCADINGESCKPVIEWIITEGYKQKHQRLTLFISSYGGAVYPSFALIDAMMGSKIPVDTVGLGYIASSALGIFMYGSHRVITPNTYIVAHQYSVATESTKQHELVAHRKSEDWLTERFIDMYTKRSKLTRDQVKEKLLGPSDTFLTAQEALEYGLADEIKLA